jgi:hypothetical protein
LLGNKAERSPLWSGSKGIDPSWLDLTPAAGAIAVASIAVHSTPAYWDSAFALADALEKTDPSRAEMAPLRTRLNLLAAGAGARLEADLWPHILGVTAEILGDASRPGQVTGGLLALHLDSSDAALRLISHTLPRLAKLLDRGRDVVFWQNRSNVLLAWGEEAATAAKGAAANPALSVAACCANWQKAGKPAPQRLGVVWPARCWPLSAGPTAKSAAWSALAEDPPVVWWGWNHENTAVDSVRWRGLDRRVRNFLEQIELVDPSARRRM